MQTFEKQEILVLPTNYFSVYPYPVEMEANLKSFLSKSMNFPFISQTISGWGAGLSTWLGSTSYPVLLLSLWLHRSHHGGRFLDPLATQHPYIISTLDGFSIA